MTQKDKTYIAIDLKSFYASAECAERGLDPLTTHLVVADESRTEKTICLAVTPPLKAYGIGGRPRLFEVIQRVREINRDRKRRSPGRMLGIKSCNSEELENHLTYEMDFIIAPPRMAKYMEISSRIYGIYLKYVAPEDIYVYSIDEVFIDATSYLKTYRLTPREFASKMILDVLNTTGIISFKNRHGYSCEAYSRRQKRRSYRKAGRDVLSVYALGTSTFNRFLEDRRRVFQKTGAERNVHYGRYCEMLD